MANGDNGDGGSELLMDVPNLQENPSSAGAGTIPNALLAGTPIEQIIAGLFGRAPGLLNTRMGALLSALIRWRELGSGSPQANQEQIAPQLRPFQQTLSGLPSAVSRQLGGYGAGGQILQRIGQGAAGLAPQALNLFVSPQQIALQKILQIALALQGGLPTPSTSTAVSTGPGAGLSGEAFGGLLGLTQPILRAIQGGGNSGAPPVNPGLLDAIGGFGEF